MITKETIIHQSYVEFKYVSYERCNEVREALHELFSMLGFEHVRITLSSIGPMGMAQQGMWNGFNIDVFSNHHH